MTIVKKSRPARILAASFAVGFFMYIWTATGLAQQSTQQDQSDSRDTVFSRSGSTFNSALDGSEVGATSDESDVSENSRNGVQPLSERRRGRALPVSPEPIVYNQESNRQQPQQNLAVDPVETGTVPSFEEDPFSPDGFRLGTMEGNFWIEQSLGYSSNVSQRADGDAGAFTQTDLHIDLTSNWSRHQWQTTVNGSYRYPFSNDEVDEPYFSAFSSLRLDLVDGFTLTGNGYYTAEEQSFSSSTLAPGAIDDPLTQGVGGSLVLERTDRKLVMQLRGRVDRQSYDDADLGGGVTVNQGDLNNTVYGVGVRVGYEISPAITPFVEGEYAIRRFDDEIDRNGNDRDGNIYTLRGGVAYDLGDKLTGEISAGIVRETYDDPRLDNLTGLSVGSELTWSPERDMQVSLSLGTETNTSIVANENGSLIYTGRLAAERQMTARWLLNGYIGYQLETNDDSNRLFEAGIENAYAINHHLALTGDLDYSSFTSDASSQDYDELSARIGIRFQK